MNSFICFLEEIDDPKNHFEIKWPLVLGLSICTFDSDFRKLGQFATLEKYQVLGTIYFLIQHPLFFTGLEIQVLDQNTMCIWSPKYFASHLIFFQVSEI